MLGQTAKVYAQKLSDSNLKGFRDVQVPSLRGSVWRREPVVAHGTRDAQKLSTSTDRCWYYVQWALETTSANISGRIAQEMSRAACLFSARPCATPLEIWRLSTFA